MEFAFDMIYRYGIMVGKREERRRRKKEGVVNGRKRNLERY